VLVSTTQFTSGGIRIDALLEQVYGLRPTSMEVVMAVPRVIETSAFQVALRRIALIATSAFFFVTVQAQAQQAHTAPEGRVIVTGEGDVAVAPDHVQLTSGVTTRAKSVKEATDTNSKVMAAVTAALLESGIEQKDIQTLRFSIQPVYASQEPRTEPKLSGYSVSNQVRVTIRQIGKIGEILDRVIAAGATDLGSIAFLVSNPSKALDQAREAAIADARRKAEVYTHASGLRLGQVKWIIEDTGVALPVPMRAQAGSASMAAPVPIATGEDMLRVKITVGFEIAP
jgi:uncharacterized protein YggE